MAGKSHLTNGGKQAPITAIVVGQNEILRAQGVDGMNEIHQVLWIVQIRDLITQLRQRLGQYAAAHARASAPEVDQQQTALLDLIELRRQGLAHIGQGREGGDDQRHRRSDLLGAMLITPLGAHGERIFPDRNGNAQSWAQFHTHRLHRGVERSIFTRFTAGRHPVGRQLDARQLDRCRQQVGDGFRHRHAPGGRCVDRGQRCALAHAHGLAGKTLEVGQRDRTVCDRHLPRTHHLVAVCQAADAAVANRDEEALGGHGGMRQHLKTSLVQVDPSELDGRELPLNRAHDPLHFRGFSKQHVHRHLDRSRSPHAQH